MSSKLEKQTLVIPAGDVELRADLAVPSNVEGLVVFAHGSGNSRKSPRNRAVADMLQEHGFATLLFDLLAAEEEEENAVDADLRFDVPMLTQRLGEVTDWIVEHPPVRELPVGYLGASTGAAAALVAAATRPRQVQAVVSRGGRSELVGRSLGYLRAPTLFAVGGEDAETLEDNRDAVEKISVPARLHVVSDASELFEETSALEEVADQAGNWFGRHLGEVGLDEKGVSQQPSRGG